MRHTHFWGGVVACAMIPLLSQATTIAHWDFEQGTPLQWTIEVSVKLNNAGGWNTIIGKDGSSAAVPPSDFYIQNNGIDDRLRLDIATLANERITIDSDFVPLTGQWYGFAGVSDGVNLTLYADKLDGNGYQSVGTAPFAVGGNPNNALANGGGSNWTFGRGWYNGGFADRIDGNLDNIRFSDVALAPSELLAVIPEPGTLALVSLGLLALVGRTRRR